MDLLSNLNDMQKKAVLTTEGPVLILAGAGSGKTTVLVSRLAYILSEKNASPYSILAITFTNKAANEMKERIRAKIGDVADQMWIGTFHSMCVRILRSNIELLGYNKDFIIYDSSDTKLLYKECYKDLNIDDKKFPPKMVSYEISKAKDDVINPEVYRKVNGNDFRLKTIADIYALYQQKLKKNNAVDFDDLIMLTIQLFLENKTVLQKYQDKFKYIMVDEYQDTNNAQYMLISLLSEKYRNLCVVGDDDQSIYKFRGANIKNILDYETQFPDAVTIKLEQNYRSTENILNAANAVIANNKGRKGKRLWTDLGEGEKITHFVASNEHEEARYIANQVSEHIKNGGKYSDCAVLYRINAQSRVLEEQFLQMNIPYRILAGLRFYDRKEIKDMIAYLRIVYNHGDDISVRRVVNEPKRGIGAATVEKAMKIAEESDLSLYDVLENAENFLEIKRSAKNIKVFTDIIDRISSMKNTVRLSELTEIIMNETGYASAVQAISDKEGTSRYENLSEFVSVIKEYETILSNEASLGDFLERVSLVSDTDNYNEDDDSVVFMTIHSAKGLEFPIVFLPGLENGIFPGAMSLGDREGIEEERRLCYVAITRAKRKLYITNSTSRMLFGKTVFQPISIFVKEIPSDCMTEEKSVKSHVYGALKNFGFFENKREPYNWRKAEVKRTGTRFAAGDRVSHPKFGEGNVISAQPFGDDYKVEVIFDKYGKKMLMSNFAKLEKI